MKEEKLSEKDWVVLDYFIQNESFLLSEMKCCIKKPIIKKCRDGKEHFLAYAKKIHNDTHSRISNRWAAEVCQKMINLGVFDNEMIRPPRQKNDTEHYYLRSDLSSFRKIIRLIVENENPSVLVYLFSKVYFQKNINESLIREIFSEKNVEIRRSIDLWNWSPSEAKVIFEKYFSKSPDKKLSFNEYIEEMLKYKYTKEKNQLPFFETICLRLPVLKEEINESNKLSQEQLSILENINKEEFEKYPWLKFQYSGIVDHYIHLQQERWIIPMLALIKASPIALDEFLNGDWKIETLEGKECISFSQDGLDSFKMTFFRILFKAISDIAITRRVPEDGDVESAYLRPCSISEINEKDCLLQIILNSNICVRFDAGFDTHRDYIGTEAGDVFELPDERYYWVKAWIHYPSSSPYSPFLSHADINNYNHFIEKLTDNTKEVSKYIVGKFSNKMKNFLGHIDVLPLPPDEFKNDLLLEINKILLLSDLSKDIVFSANSLSDYVRNEIKSYQDHKNSPFYKSLYSWERICVNRSILEDIFIEDISKNKMRIDDEERIEANED